MGAIRGLLTRRARVAMLARRTMFLALLLLVPVSAGGHVNERGMDYRSFKNSAGAPCCSHEDCHAAEKFTETLENGREVIRLLIDGIWIRSLVLTSSANTRQMAGHIGAGTEFGAAKAGVGVRLPGA